MKINHLVIKIKQFIFEFALRDLIKSTKKRNFEMYCDFINISRYQVSWTNSKSQSQ